MASTQHIFDIALSDIDRGVYESLSLPVSRHPSESAPYLVARVLAYLLEHEEGVAFSSGLCAGDEPAVWVRDLTGALRAWIEVGTPAAERLHRATKAVERVVVYCHKDPGPWLQNAAGTRVHAPERLTVVELDRKLVAALADRLSRRTTWEVTVSEGELYVDVGGESFSASLPRHPWPGGC